MPRTIINVTHLVVFSWKTLLGMTMHAYNLLLQSIYLYDLLWYPSQYVYLR